MSKDKYFKIRKHFQKKDPKIYLVIKDLDFDNWFSQEDQDYFISLSRAIVYQQLSGKAGTTIYSRFADLMNKKITPTKVLKLTDEAMRSAGLSRSKASYIKDLAFHIKAKKIQFENFPKMSQDEITSELTKVKGIGPWTAEMFLMFTLKRPNIFSFGDLGLKKGFEKIYKTTEKEKMDKVIKNWEPYKTYGAIALWQSLEN